MADVRNSTPRMSEVDEMKIRPAVVYLIMQKILPTTEKNYIMQIKNEHPDFPWSKTTIWGAQGVRMVG